MATPNFSPRTRWFILALAALSGIVIGIIVLYPCVFIEFTNNNPPCNGVSFTKVSTRHIPDKFNYPDSIFRLPYTCNQLILNPGAPKADSIRNGLIKKCFKKVKTCPCGPGYELWENPNVEGIDVGALAGTGTGVRGVGDGLILNVSLSFDDPKDILHIDSLENPIMGNCNLKRPAKISIVDSGVDYNAGSGSSDLTRFAWLPYNIQNTCIRNFSNRGISYLGGNMAGEPKDEHGHGSSVNAVAVGASTMGPHYNVSHEINNIRITNQSSKEGSLFDALCGLYYAANQSPDVINISWGFENVINPNDDNLVNIDADFRLEFANFFNYSKERNIVLVAGAGNLSRILCEYVQFYPASLAAEHDNLISVGALNASKTDLAEFSNRCFYADRMISLYVCGENVKMIYPRYLQSSPQTGAVIQSGTSFAAPVVTRVVAALRGKNPAMDAASIKSLILSYSQTLMSNAELPQITFCPFDYRRLMIDLCEQNSISGLQ